MPGEATPNQADQDGSGFAIGYKGRGRGLAAAFARLQRYALPFGSPPWLVVYDFEIRIIRTAWTDRASEATAIAPEDLRDPRRPSMLDGAATPAAPLPPIPHGDRHC